MSENISWIRKQAWDNMNYSIQLSMLILTLTDRVLAYGDFIYNVKYYDWD